MPNIFFWLSKQISGDQESLWWNSHIKPLTQKFVGEISLPKQIKSLTSTQMTVPKVALVTIFMFEELKRMKISRNSIQILSTKIVVQATLLIESKGDKDIFAIVKHIGNSRQNLPRSSRDYSVRLVSLKLSSMGRIGSGNSLSNTTSLKETFFN